MKIITLNTWGGKVKEPLISFLATHRDTDVFCFQEVFHAAKKTLENFDDVHLDLYNKMQSLLPDMSGYFCPTVGDYYGIATFVKKNFIIQATGDITIYENPEWSGRGGNHTRKALWVDITCNGKPISILNVHGLWNGKGKTDTPDRMEQSKRIRNFMDSVKGSQIVCGDFNLLPETESVSILEKGMQNLVKENNVASTRTSLYTRSETSGKFADYIFVSPDIKITRFEVLPDEVSDHAALYAEF